MGSQIILNRRSSMLLWKKNWDPVLSPCKWMRQTYGSSDAGQRLAAVQKVATSICLILFNKSRSEDANVLSALTKSG